MGTKVYSSRVSFRRFKRTLSWDSLGVFAGVTTSTSLSSVDTGGTRTGVSNPKWRSQIARGECATTQFSGSKTTAGVKVGTFHQRRHFSASNDKRVFETSGVDGPGMFNPASLTLISLTKAKNRASQDFFKKARKAQRNIQSGVLIGELLETMRMIRDPALAMRALTDVFIDSASSKVGKALRSSSKKSATYRRNVATGKAIGDSWLEFAFGWAPLASDLKHGAEALARIHVRMEREFQHVTGIGLQEAATILTDQFNQIPGEAIWFREQVRDTFKATSKIYGRVRVGVPGSPDCRAMAALGLTLSDFVPTAWELIPWTFLIDYFSNIGDVIDACCFPRSDIAWTSLCDRQVTRRTSTWKYSEAETIKQIKAGGGVMDYTFMQDSSSFSERSTVSRGLTIVSTPSIEFELPGRLSQLLNIGALALARQRPPR